jgi:hypothetical protein
MGELRRSRIHFHPANRVYFGGSWRLCWIEVFHQSPEIALGVIEPLLDTQRVNREAFLGREEK